MQSPGFPYDPFQKTGEVLPPPCPKCRLGRFTGMTPDGAWFYCDNCKHYADPAYLQELAQLQARLDEPLRRRQWLADQVLSSSRISPLPAPKAPARPPAPKPVVKASLPAAQVPVLPARPALPPPAPHRPVAAAGPAAAANASSPSSPRKGIGTQRLLIGLGATLLSVAGIFFAAVAWTLMGPAARMLLLALLGTGVAALANRLKGKIPAAANAMAVVGASLIAVAAYAGVPLGLYGDLAGSQTSLALGVASGVLAGVYLLGLKLTHMRAWVWSATTALLASAFLLSLSLTIATEIFVMPVALAAFGVLTALTRRKVSSRSWSQFETLKKDIKTAVRTLRWGFVVLTLVTTTIWLLTYDQRIGWSLSLTAVAFMLPLMRKLDPGFESKAVSDVWQALYLASGLGMLLSFEALLLPNSPALILASAALVISTTFPQYGRLRFAVFSGVIGASAFLLPAIYGAQGGRSSFAAALLWVFLGLLIAAETGRFKAPKEHSETVRYFDLAAAFIFSLGLALALSLTTLGTGPELLSATTAFVLIALGQFKGYPRPFFALPVGAMLFLASLILPMAQGSSYSFRDSGVYFLLMGASLFVMALNGYHKKVVPGHPYEILSGLTLAAATAILLTPLGPGPSLFSAAFACAAALAASGRGYLRYHAAYPYAAATAFLGFVIPGFAGIDYSKPSAGAYFLAVGLTALFVAAKHQKPALKTARAWLEGLGGASIGMGALALLINVPDLSPNPTLVVMGSALLASLGIRWFLKVSWTLPMALVMISGSWLIPLTQGQGSTEIMGAFSFMILGVALIALMSRPLISVNVKAHRFLDVLAGLMVSGSILSLLGQLPTLGTPNMVATLLGALLIVTVGAASWLRLWWTLPAAGVLLLGAWSRDSAVDGGGSSVYAALFALILASALYLSTRLYAKNEVKSTDRTTLDIFSGVGVTISALFAFQAASISLVPNIWFALLAAGFALSAALSLKEYPLLLSAALSSSVVGWGRSLNQTEVNWSLHGLYFLIIGIALLAITRVRTAQKPSGDFIRKWHQRFDLSGAILLGLSVSILTDSLIKTSPNYISILLGCVLAIMTLKTSAFKESWALPLAATLVISGVITPMLRGITISNAVMGAMLITFSVSAYLLMRLSATREAGLLISVRTHKAGVDISLGVLGAFGITMIMNEWDAFLKPNLPMTVLGALLVVLAAARKVDKEWSLTAGALLLMLALATGSEFSSPAQYAYAAVITIALYCVAATGKDFSGVTLTPAAWAALAFLGSLVGSATWVKWQSRYDGIFLEVYTLPIALLLLTAGVITWRRMGAGRRFLDFPSVLTLLPALLVLIVPAGLIAFEVDYEHGSSEALWRSVALLVIGGITTALGARLRVLALVAGGTTAVLFGLLGHLLLIGGMIPGWLTLALTGALLLSVGARWEWLRDKAPEARKWVGALR